MTSPASLSFDQFLHSQLYLEQLVRPSGSAHFAAFVAALSGHAVQITVGPQTDALVGSYWDVTVSHQQQPVAVRRTRDEAVEAAQEVRHSIGGKANVWLKGQDGRYREEWTYPRSADRYPPEG